MAGRTHLFFKNSTMDRIRSLAATLDIADNPYAVTNVVEESICLLFKAICDGEISESDWEKAKGKVGFIKRERRFYVPEGVRNAVDPTGFDRGEEGVTRFHCYFGEQTVLKARRIMHGLGVDHHFFAVCKIAEEATEMVLDHFEKGCPNQEELERRIKNIGALKDVEPPSLYHDGPPTSMEDMEEGNIEENADLSAM